MLASDLRGRVTLGGTRFKEDETGQWWEIRATGWRTRLSEHKCKVCGQSFWKRPSHPKLHCSRDCGRVSQRKKMLAKRNGQPGGKHVDSQGYVRLYFPEHPEVMKDRCIKEHRYVMEQVIGRLLHKGESVHHRNGIKTDNRPENLELWRGVHPAGQRASAPHCPTCKCNERRTQ